MCTMFSILGTQPTGPCNGPSLLATSLVLAMASRGVHGSYTAGMLSGHEKLYAIQPQILNRP